MRCVRRGEKSCGKLRDLLIPGRSPKFCLKMNEDYSPVIKLENDEDGILTTNTQSEWKSQEQKISVSNKKARRSDPICTATQNSVNSTRIETEKPIKRFECEVCDKNFASLYCLKVHLRIHTGEKPYLCDVCGRAFTQQSDLIRHSHIPTGFRPKKCLDCGKGFCKSGDLNKHIKTMHTLEKPYECDLCGKAYSTRDKLMTHIISHTRKKPFTCDICSKTYGYKSALSRHVKTVHTR